MPTLDMTAVATMPVENSPTGTPTFTVEELSTLIQRSSGIAAERLFNEGIECKVLSGTGGWQMGRVKLVFDFVPTPVAPVPPTR